MEQLRKHRIAEALNKAAADFVDDIDKVVENNGTNLSGGQKQRIGLARAFIQKNQSSSLMKEPLH